MADMSWHAPRMWEGGRCIVIGGGPSMPGQFNIPEDLVAKVTDRADPTGPEVYSHYMEPIHGEHVIVVNDGYRLGSWPDICFFGDHGWYRVHRMHLAKWPGLKVSCSPALRENQDGIKHLRRDPGHKVGLSENPSRVAWGFNSGASAINLAVHLGVRRVVLLGFDMAWPDGKSHWHQGHGNEDRPLPNYSKWMKGLDVMAKDAARLGIEIINASSESSIEVFPKVRLMEVL